MKGVTRSYVIEKRIGRKWVQWTNAAPWFPAFSSLKNAKSAAARHCLKEGFPYRIVKITTTFTTKVMPR
jgi:hypothetical protein